jgi:Na+/H+ antiporter NhaC
MIVLGLDYGPMKMRELAAIANGDLGPMESREENEDEVTSKKGIILDLLFPIIVLIISCVLGMIYVGGFFDGANLIDAFGDTDASVGLPWGALIALVITLVYLVARKAVTFKQAMESVSKGFIAMVPAILILTFALTLKTVTNGLGADVFVAGVMENAAAGLKSFLPAIIFLVACFLAFSTGTSWGTFGILIPIITAIFPATSELYIIGISACLAGAVCGDHCSPISDTTIMASAGANSDHIVHVSTQLPYALTVAGVSFVAFIISGFVQNVLICLPVAIALMLVTVIVINEVQKRCAKKAEAPKADAE